MRIEFEHTRADWLAYVRYLSMRSASQRRRFWTSLAGAIAFTLLVLWVADEGLGRRLDPTSLLVGVLLVGAILLVLTRFRRSWGGIPTSWLGPQVWELREDGLQASTSTVQSFLAWSAVKELHETDNHLFLRLDEIATLVLPKRNLAPYGGAAVVRAEIERLLTGAGAVDGAASDGRQRETDARPATMEAGGAAVSAPTPPASPALTPPPSSTTAPPSAHVRRPAFLRNLIAGARLSFFVPLHREHFSPSARQAALLAILTVIGWILLDRLGAPGDAQLVRYEVGQLVGFSAIVAILLILLGPGSNNAHAGVTFMTAIAAASPFLLLIGLLCALPESNALWCRGLMLVLPALTMVVLYRAQRVAADEFVPVAVAKAVGVVIAVWWLFGNTLYVQPTFWYALDAEAGEGSWTDAERELFGQPDLIDAQLARLKAGEGGVTETYWIGFAGYGEQQVFGKEVSFARDALAQRLDLDGRSLQLINAPHADAAAAPLATVSGLRRALGGVAARMNVEEDVLILFLTSHGSEDGVLSVSQGEMPLEQLRPPALRAALDEAGIRWRIIVISACHSGRFIPDLEDAHTLIATAARADRSSFGCTDERELTYYGEALFRDALPASSGFMDAFERAHEIVREHETAEKIKGAERSEPQVWIGERMRAKVAELQFRTAS